MYKGTRQNSYVICAQTYTIKLFEFFTFYEVLDFYSPKTKTTKIRSNAKTIKTMHIKRCTMHKCMTMKHLMHDNEASNAWRVLQRSKELDQCPKEQKLNHRNLSSSKHNNCFEWVSHEKWDEGWKNKNQRCISTRR